jgi:hypothetical protein
MLRITADRFSGIRAPEWIITDEQEARTTLKEIAKNRSIVAESVSAEAGLGFRGFTIEPLSDELAQDFQLPASIWLPVRVPLALKRMRLLSV